MPEVSLNLLKEKIIKTDTVITLLADKNEKISQLREKLKQLYHKYVNRLKECEVLQLKVDFCKLEHEPLEENLKVISEKYENLYAEHEQLTNTSQIRYQTKCMELELQIKKYEELLLQKDQCTSCHELNVKYDSVCRKYDKINKQFNKLTEKYKEEQDKIKITVSNFEQAEVDHVNKLLYMKEDHTKEISKLEDNIASIQLSRHKLEEEIIHLKSKIDLSISQENVEHQPLEHKEALNVCNCDNNNIIINTSTAIANKLEDDDFLQILHGISHDFIPALLSPLPENSIFSEANETVEEPSELCISANVASTDTVCHSDNFRNEDINIPENTSHPLGRTSPALESDFESLNQFLMSNCLDEYCDAITSLEVNDDTVISSHDMSEIDVDIHEEGANILALDNSSTASEEISSIKNDRGAYPDYTIKNDRGAYPNYTNSLKTIINCHRKSRSCTSVLSPDNDLLGFSANQALFESPQKYEAREPLLKNIERNINISSGKSNTDNTCQANRSICNITNDLKCIDSSVRSMHKQIDSDFSSQLQLRICDDNEQMCYESIDLECVEDNIKEKFIPEEMIDFDKDNCKSFGAVGGNNEYEIDPDYVTCRNSTQNACLVTSYVETSSDVIPEELHSSTTTEVASETLSENLINPNDHDSNQTEENSTVLNLQDNIEVTTPTLLLNNINNRCKISEVMNNNSSIIREVKIDGKFCEKSDISSKNNSEIKQYSLSNLKLSRSEDEQCNNNKPDNYVCNRLSSTSNNDSNVIEVSNFHLEEDFVVLNPLTLYKKNNIDAINVTTSDNHGLNALNQTCKQDNLRFTDQEDKDSAISIVNKIMTYQKESNRYTFRTVLGDNILGFTKDSDRHVQQNRKKILRNRGLYLSKMKRELFNSVIRYINRKINLNTVSKFPEKHNKSHSTKFKNMRKQQMLRWRRFRELYLPSTDTDSDYSRKLIRTKKKVKNKSQVQQKSTENTTEVEVSSISEDEHTIRQIFKEERKYQTLILDHKALEDFYHMSTDNESHSELIRRTKGINVVSKSTDDSSETSSNSLELSVDKDDSNNDSGYFKSDSDYARTGESNKRKRTQIAKEANRKKKCVLTDIQEDKICDANLENNSINSEARCVQSNLIVEVDLSVHSDKKNTLMTNEINNVVRENYENSSISINSGNTITKSNITTEICSLLDQAESVLNNDVASNYSTLENSGDLMESFESNCEKINTDLQSLFGSDCESICSSDCEINASNAEVVNGKNYSTNKRKKSIADTNKTNVYALRSNTQQRNKKKMKEGLLNLETTSKCYRKSNSISMKNILKRRVKLKSNVVDDKRKIRAESIESEDISKTEAVSPESDPLHIRLKQENLLKVTRQSSNSKKTIQTSYKRSNSLKKQVSLLQPIKNPLDAIEAQSVVQKSIANLKKPLRPTQLGGLLKKLLTFPDKSSILDEVAEAFAGQEHDNIFRMLMHELNLDVGKPDTKYTPPAPVLTETQRIILGLLVKLDRTTSAGLLDSFMQKAEKYLLTLAAGNLAVLGRITRLYLAVCKLQRKIHRMRRMVCDSFYFMGDLSVPFLFTVLSTWTEVMPFESELNDEPIVKVIIEIIKRKTCNINGYHLISLKKLLEVYYGYAMEEGNVEEMFLEIFNAYTETRSKKFEYAILILCKNLTKSWVLDKIRLHMKPLIENDTDIPLRKHIVMLVKKITKEFDSVEVNKLVTFDKVPD